MGTYKTERYKGRVFPPDLEEGQEIERVSPSSVRFRRYDKVGVILEDRDANPEETAVVDKVDRLADQQKKLQDFIQGVNALPGTNPLKKPLQDFIQSQGWTA